MTIHWNGKYFIRFAFYILCIYVVFSVNVSNDKSFKKGYLNVTLFYENVHLKYKTFIVHYFVPIYLNFVCLTKN